LLESGHTRELTAVGKPPGSVDRLAFFDRSPAAHGVIILHRKAHGIHQLMTAGTGGVGAVLGQPFADRKAFAYAGVLLQGWHGPRRRWWWDPKKIVKDPLAAYDRRGSGRVGTHRENASVAPPAPPPAVFAQRDAPEAAAVHMRDAVVLGQPFVDERVIRVQQV